jgi:hypothetical protein
MATPRRLKRLFCAATGFAKAVGKTLRGSIAETASGAQRFITHCRRQIAALRQPLDRGKLEERHNH